MCSKLGYFARSLISGLNDVAADFKGSTTHLQGIQIFMKVRLQMATDIRKCSESV